MLCYLSGKQLVNPRLQRLFKLAHAIPQTRQLPLLHEIQIPLHLGSCLFLLILLFLLLIDPEQPHVPLDNRLDKKPVVRDNQKCPIKGPQGPAERLYRVKVQMGRDFVEDEKMWMVPNDASQGKTHLGRTLAFGSILGHTIVPSWM